MADENQNAASLNNSTPLGETYAPARSHMWGNPSSFLFLMPPLTAWQLQCSINPKALLCKALATEMGVRSSCTIFNLK